MLIALLWTLWVIVAVCGARDTWKLWKETRRRGRMRWAMGPCTFAFTLGVLSSFIPQHRTMTVEWRGVGSLSEVHRVLER